MKTLRSDDARQMSVVVLGSKPNAALPTVAAHVVLAANNAVELGLLYRRRYGSYIIGVTSSRVIRDTPGVQESFKRSAPDEVVLLGDDLQDPERFVRETLGLLHSTVTVVNKQERNRLITRAVGWRRILLHLDALRLRGLRSIRYAVPALFDVGKATWLQRSTGLNSILYALQRFPAAREVIVAGVGMQAGGHFAGNGKFFEKDAQADRVMMRHWRPRKRTRVCTTDDAMHQIGNVPRWRGDVFFHTN